MEYIFEYIEKSKLIIAKKVGFTTYNYYKSIKAYKQAVKRSKYPNFKAYK